MRFPCPNCGYSDNWRPCGFDYDAEFCTVDDLGPTDPPELRTITPGEIIEIGRYAYRITQNHRIYRAAVAYARVNPQFGHSMMESGKKRRSPHGDQSRGLHRSQGHRVHRVDKAQTKFSLDGKLLIRGRNPKRREEEHANL
jgi:hypothetical protein